ncbi:MAG: polysaccharide biosynthesis protein [Sphingobacteriales bacterium]|nr:MAG: polysaccharide biosynthesis protein [Sphingobacteriales bacterium]
MKFLKILLSKHYAPRWLILQIDLLFCVVSVVLAFLLRSNFNFYDSSLRELLPLNMGVFLLLRIISFYIFKTYHGVVRYTSTEDAKRIFLALTSGSLVLLAFNIYSQFVLGQLYFPYSFVVIEYFSTALMMTSFRIFVKIVYSEIKNSEIDKKNVFIFGAGESGLITKRTIDHDKDSDRKIVGFLDDNLSKRGKFLEGVQIYHLEQNFPDLISKYKIDEVVISIQELSRKRKEEIVDFCLKHKINVKAIPPATHWINGELSPQQISDIKIEHLLEREPIRLDQEQIRTQLTDKRVLVTGACGSIGSELVRQIIKFYPREIILLDQAESPLYELELELREQSNYVNFRTVLADVYNRNKIETVITTYKPEIIYHAAAYKHVPLMEENPSEGIMTNIAGTKNLADLAVAHGVKEFVFISTDKAVNPTNVMGATKRVAEIYVQSLNAHLQNQNTHQTKFITTRFGNVLGSNGSVIPRFRKQLASGGPITVTHPEICRYFMTIPEACQLILEAGMMGKGGEIFIFDMGEPVKIVDLAKKMIILSGLRPGKDIQIIYTGLRPGEKIKEELLNNKEKTLPTHHEKIMIGKVREYPFPVVAKEIQELINMLGTELDKTMVAKIKTIVPEFISNNSIYEELDKLTMHPGIEVNQE